MNFFPSPRWSPRITFSATVNGATRRKCWCTMQIPASSASRGEAKATGTPESRISPSSGRYRPVRMFESVDLPAPFSPRSAWTSPSAASKSTWSLATTPGNRFVIPRRVTAAAMGTAGRSRGSARPGCLSLRAPDDALDEPVDRVELLHGQTLALLHAELAALVVERARELVPLAALDQRLLLRDQ